MSLDLRCCLSARPLGNRRGDKLKGMRVYFPEPTADDAMEELSSQVGPDVQVLTGEIPTDYEVLIAGRPTDEMLTMPSLRALILPFAGVPQTTLEQLRKNRHISGHNLHHNASDTAEVALALLFAAAKDVVPLDKRLRHNDWGYDAEYRSLALEGKTALILGLGQIGQRIGRVLVALGLNVLAINRTGSPSGIEGVETFSTDRLHDLLPRANILMVALPMTSQTTALIRAKELAMLPKDAVLVNIARGPIVEEEALYNALKRGQLHSAGLDVWYRYPSGAEPGTPEPEKSTAPSNFPFSDLENVVMSPHRGGTSADTEVHRIRGLASVIKSIAKGEPAPNKIDLDAGY